MTEERTVTTVEIAGEEYTIRSHASQEYTRECARYVNEALSEIMSRGNLVEVHKAAILAALALADELFQARRGVEAMEEELRRKSTRLLDEIERRAPASGLASGD